ncbi:MAG TPA: pyridoxamine kinase [Thermotogota bacterium]|nr:pyridoxamine kinase [Thermotogota bacterium]HRW33817.1 pyridoxamine kinase [Thermotogota bacterium]
MKNIVPRIAAIHDISGFGRASLTVIIPIMSNMGFQVCPIPTAVLSTHTGGFEGFKFVDLTEHLQGYIQHWKTLDLQFDAIYSGFLGSEAQLDIVRGFFKDFRHADQLKVVDPVLGDDGKRYQTVTDQMVSGMKELIKEADLITPNITEAAFLLDRQVPDTITDDQIKDWAASLTRMGPTYAVITSVPDFSKHKCTATVAYNSKDNRYWKVTCDYIPAFYPGTGDMFTSVLVGSLMQSDSLPIALDRAQRFVSLAIRATFGFEIPHREGVLLERVLDSLKSPVTSTSYELI